MNSYIALLIWLVLLLGLLLFDPARKSGISGALWVPVIWMFIIASRLPSVWLSGEPAAGGGVSSALEDGNLLDRSVSLILIFVALGILLARSFHWDDFFRRNIALTAFVLFGLFSVIWSDFPLVAFKRWFRDLAMYLMVLVVLSDPFPLEAIRTLLRRVCYLTVPLSLLLIKYFPDAGVSYTIWGVRETAGATTSKNDLGVLCLVCGLFFFWDTLSRWSDRKEWQTRRIFAVNLIFLAMTLRLLYFANSATSTSCFATGCAVILVVYILGKRHPVFVGALLPLAFIAYAVLAYGFNLNNQLAPMVGRNPDLTDRTYMWQVLLGMHTNPLIGVGYQSFFLGSQLQTFWQRFGGKVTEAHDGYLGVYLNLGLIGLTILVVFLIGSYRTILKRLRPFSSFAVLGLTLWIVLLFYNISEEAMKLNLMWVTFLLVAIDMPLPAEEEVRDLAPLEGADAARSSGFPGYSTSAPKKAFNVNRGGGMVSPLRAKKKPPFGSKVSLHP
jgi:exopolysaccharide production protein ExoQ